MKFQLVEEQDKKILVYVLVVYLIGGDTSSHNLQNSSNGWTVSRNLADFHTLHENLCQVCIIYYILYILTTEDGFLKKPSLNKSKVILLQKTKITR